MKLTLKEDITFKKKWNGSIVRKIQSSVVKDTSWYFVEICMENGESRCTCLHFAHNKDPACKHIIAVSAHTANLSLLVKWLSIEKNVRPFGSFMLRPVGGRKPGQKPRSIAGGGFTQRAGMEVATMDLQELGYCLLGAGHAEGIWSSRLHLSSSVILFNILNIFMLGRVWEDSTYLFLIKKELSIHANTKCPGCRNLFKDKPAVFDLVLSHREQDYQERSDRIPALPRERFYHLNNYCVRIRHPTFDPTIKGKVLDDKELGMLTDLEKISISDFRAARIL